MCALLIQKRLRLLLVLAATFLTPGAKAGISGPPSVSPNSPSQVQILRKCRSHKAVGIVWPVPVCFNSALARIPDCRRQIMGGKSILA